MEHPACRVCRCTNDRACTWFEVMGDGSTQQFACSWVEPDLCSECAPPAAPEPLLFDAGGVPLVFK